MFQIFFMMILVFTVLHCHGKSCKIVNMILHVVDILLKSKYFNIYCNHFPWTAKVQQYAKILKWSNELKICIMYKIQEQRKQCENYICLRGIYKTRSQEASGPGERGRDESDSSKRPTLAMPFQLRPFSPYSLLLF